MNEHVRSQDNPIYKCGPANLTLLHLLLPTKVLIDQMNPEIVLVVETLFAEIAFEAALVLMSLRHVQAQPLLHSEALAAIEALV